MHARLVSVLIVAAAYVAVVDTARYTAMIWTELICTGLN